MELPSPVAHILKGFSAGCLAGVVDDGIDDLADEFRYGKAGGPVVFQKVDHIVGKGAVASGLSVADQFVAAGGKQPSGRDLVQPLGTVGWFQRAAGEQGA